MQSAQTHPFTMDDNLLVSVIKSQAGSLTKALLEGVMNSIDAGATRVDVGLTDTTFTITDDGRGFRSEDEIRQWFGRFGTPHVEGDARFGRFRMGRGQMMAFAATTWTSGPFRMQVDIETKGLTYALEPLGTPVRGCQIVGLLYKPLNDYRLPSTLREFRKFVAYAPVPVWLNGELISQLPKKVKSWTYQDDYAWYRLDPRESDLQVYNQGIFVTEMGTWRCGLGGVVVSKQPLQVNFARNDVMEDTCPVWRRIGQRLSALVMERLTTMKKLTDENRKYLARQLPVLAREDRVPWRRAKLLTDPSGKHLALEDLAEYSRYAYIEEATPSACALHGTRGLFVVTDVLLNRFAVGGLAEFLEHLKKLVPEYVPDTVEILDLSKVVRGIGDYREISTDGLSRRECAAFATLALLNLELGRRLEASGIVTRIRDLRLGTQKANKAIAWTDGESYITANRKYLKRFAVGYDGVLAWLLTLVHEYTHDTDNSESHEHGEVFYRTCHDTLMQELGLGRLVQEGLATYLTQLKIHGAPRPLALRRQLKGQTT